MFQDLLRRAVQRLPYKLVRIVVDESEHDRVKHRLRNKRRTWRQRKQDTGCQNEEEYGSEERHHGVKHGYTYW